MQDTNSGSNAGCGGMGKPPRNGLYKRFFAWLMSKLQEHYGDDIETRKRDLLREVHGTVVEVGAGAGANLDLYPEDVRLLLVEPNAHMHAYLRRAADRTGTRFEICAGAAERMDVPDEVADFVVCTLVLCSVEHPEAALREVVRVLKPGGAFLFLEHVAAPAGTGLRRWQRRLRGFWKAIGDGCTLDRETWETVQEAGFGECRIEHFEVEGLPIARPHIVGTAMKAFL